MSAARKGRPPPPPCSTRPTGDKEVVEDKVKPERRSFRLPLPAPVPPLWSSLERRRAGSVRGLWVNGGHALSRLLDPTLPLLRARPRPRRTPPAAARFSGDESTFSCL